ncbi:outer membrane usher protein PefC [Morganella morganii]|nr:outer membrane usher protein PefC [Morganella morganii]
MKSGRNLLVCDLKPVIDKRDRPAHCLFRISVLARLVLLPAVSGCLVWLSASSVSAASELNLNFIHGADKQHAPAILKEGTSFPPGQYVVDIFFNNQRTSRQILTIIPEDAQALCLTPDWMVQAHLPLNPDKFKAQYDAARECYRIGDYPAATMRFDYGTQTLYISEPQVTLRAPEAGDDWDYGIPGFKLRYSANAGKNQHDKTTYYGNINMTANAGRWVLSGSTTGFSGRGFESPQAMASTVIAPLRSTLELGKTRTRSTLMSDYSFYGASLLSDNNMTPWANRGYAPVISGVAQSNARVTVSQRGYILASQIVPPGEYSLNNISPIGNGDLTVTVEEEDGSKTERIYPVTTLPTLLRAGDFNYNVSLGTRNDDSQAKGVFVAGSLDYGFEPLTLNLAAILHRQYQGAGIGLTRNMGMLGALEVSTNVSRSVFDENEPFWLHQYTDTDDPIEREKNAHNRWLWQSYGRGRRVSGPQTGISATVKYAKSLGDKTNLHLLTWRYTGEKYVDFAGFNPHQGWLTENRKSRYEALISHNIGGSYLNFSGWSQSYRNRGGNDSGANVSFSTSLKGASLSFHTSYSHTPWAPNDYSLSMNVSMPFTVADKQYYSSAGMNYRPHGGSQMNTSVSGNPSDNLSWNASAGVSENSRSVSASVGYTLDKMQTGASLTQSHYRNAGSQTSGSLSASGAVMGTAESGLLFTREQNGTVAVVKIKDVPGVTFNGSRPTGRDGVTVLPLSEYSHNDILIDPGNVPDNLELLDTVYNVVPTRNAIVYREFNYTQVKRYILKLTGSDGKPLSLGGTAVTQDGLDAGFVANGGLLLSTLLAEPEFLTVTTTEGTQCRVDMTGVKADAGKLTEVRCE